MCQVSFFFLGAVSEIQSSKVFLFFQLWLPQHMTYDIKIIIERAHVHDYTSSRTNGENFVLIRQAVAEKNTKVLCGQTKR